jgi:acetyltransferase-like isoleucine patch superfamily enzyme
MQGFLLKVKRGETPVFRALRRLGQFLLQHGSMPVPRVLMGPLRVLYHVDQGLRQKWRRGFLFFYGEPLFRGRCSRIGKDLDLAGMPFVLGHASIFIGEHVKIGASFTVFSGRFLDQPRLVIGDGVEIGDKCVVSVNQEVILEDGVTVGVNCRITDNDGHPREAERRAQMAPLTARDIRPVQIRANSRIGAGCYIMKGVTIGEGAVVGPGSVVITDVPPHCMACGNPAEVRTQPAPETHVPGGALV